MRALGVLLIVMCCVGLLPVQAKEETFLPAESEVITAENANRLIEIASVGDGHVLDISLSPDGGSVAVVTTQGIDIYDVNHPQTPPRTIGKDFTMVAVTFSADWSWLAIFDGSLIHIYDPKTGSRLHRFEPGGYFHYDPRYSFNMNASPDGRWLAAGFKEWMGAWEMPYANRVYYESHRYENSTPVFSRDGEMFGYLNHESDMMTSNLDPLNLWIMMDTHTWDWEGITSSAPDYAPEDRTIEIPSKNVYVGPAPDHKIWVIRQAYDAWDVWDASEELYKGRLPLHYDFEGFRPNGQALLYDQDLQSLMLYSPETEAVSRLMASRNPLQTTWNASGDVLAYMDDANTLHVVTVDTDDEKVLKLKAYIGTITEIALSDTGTDLYFIEDSTTVKRFSQISGKIEKLAYVPHGTGHFAYNGTAGLIAVGTTTGDIELWDIETRQQRDVLKMHDKPVTRLVFNADGTLLASSGTDYTMRVYDFERRRPLLLDYYSVPDQYAGESHKVPTFVFDIHNSRHLLVNAYDLRFWEKLVVYDVDGGKEVAPTSSNGNLRVMYTPQGTYLVTADDYYVTFYPADQLNEENAIRAFYHEWGLTDLSFSHNEDVVAIAESKAYSWKSGTGLTLLDPLDGSAQSFESNFFKQVESPLPEYRLLTFNGDDRYLFITGDDGKIHIWGITSAEQ